MFKKIKTILLSRIKRNKEEEWIRKRQMICLRCESNSLNVSSLSYYRFFLTTLSSFYSYIMGRSKEDNLGNCLSCEACSVYFKSFEKEENCPLNKWELLEDNSINYNIRKQRKNASNKKDK